MPESVPNATVVTTSVPVLLSSSVVSSFQRRNFLRVESLDAQVAATGPHDAKPGQQTAVVEGKDPISVSLRSCVEVVLQDGDYQWRTDGNRGTYRKVNDLEKEYYEPLVFLFNCV